MKTTATKNPIEHLSIEELRTVLENQLIEQEIQTREAEAARKIAHIVVYSEETSLFDTRLLAIRTPDDIRYLIPLQLQCRLNSHRYLNLYRVLLTDAEAEKFNLEITRYASAIITDTAARKKTAKIFEAFKQHDLLAIGF